MSARLKTHHAAVIRTIHSEIKRAPGGFQALAQATGRNAQVLINAFNPASIDTAPALEAFLDAIEFVRAEGAVNAVAGLVDMVAISVEMADTTPVSDLQGFLRVSKEFGDVLKEGAEDLDNGRFDADERVRMIRELDEAIACAVRLRAMLRGA